MTTRTHLAMVLDGASDLPWLPVAPGVSSKVLALSRNDSGWVSLLRLEPHARIPLHRHRGEVHGYLLAGRRRLGEGGRVVGPASYEYEPPGSTDSWWVEGGEPLVGLFVVRGPVEYLGANGEILFVESASSKDKAYREACAARGLQAKDLYGSPPAAACGAT